MSCSAATSAGSRTAPAQGQALRWPQFHTALCSHESRARLPLLSRQQPNTKGCQRQVMPLKQFLQSVLCSNWNSARVILYPLEKICLEKIMHTKIMSAGSGNRSVSCYDWEAAENLMTAFLGGEEQVRQYLHSYGEETRLD